MQQAQFQPPQVPNFAAGLVPSSHFIDEGPFNNRRPFIGYTRYAARHHQGGMFHCRSTGAWRTQACEDLANDQAGCFMHAALWVLSQQQFRQLYRSLQSVEADVRSPVTIVQALVLHFLGGWSIGLHYVDLDGHLVTIVGHRGPLARGLVLVLFNDSHVYAPHWLPFTSVLRNQHISLDFRDMDSLAPGGAARPEFAHVAPEIHAAWLRFAPVDRPAEPVVPPLNQNVPLPYMADDQDLHLNVLGYVCDHDPPVPVHAGSTGVMQRRSNTTVFNPIVWTERTDVNSGLCRIVRGKPDFMDRVQAHLPFGRQGIMWEFSASVLIGAEICEDDFVFVEECAVHPQDPCLNVRGQYLPERVARIVTDSGTWVLVDCRCQSFSGKDFRIFALQKDSSTVFGLLWTMLPLTTETVVSVQVSLVDEVEPALSAFPTENAGIRAAYDQLARHISPELVGSLMTSRNEELALTDRSGLRPGEVARALEQLRRVTDRTWVTIPGAASQPILGFELFMST